MAEFLFVMLALSALIAGWAYARAARLHRRIEASYPGLNDIMRGAKRRRSAR